MPTGVEIRASELEDLQITLINDGDVAWLADPRDAQYVHAWLVDSHGDRIGSSRFAFGSHHHVVDELAPGQTVRLPVSFDRDAHMTAAGVYGVDAVMPAINLWSTRSSIVVLS